MYPVRRDASKPSRLRIWDTNYCIICSEHVMNLRAPRQTIARQSKVQHGSRLCGQRRTKYSVAALVALGLILTLFFCGACTRSKPEAKPQPPHEDKLVIFAAASLRNAFTAIGEDFKRTHPGVTLTFNFAGTQELRTQVEQGAEADVFASADQRHMGELVKATRAVDPVTFARNEPVLVVAKESATKIQGIADLPAANQIIIGAPEVPIGRYTLQILDRASAKLGADFRTRVEAKVVSRELNVRQVFAKVSLGEAEVGFVYRTDAAGAEDSVKIVTIPPDINVTAAYPIAIVANAKHPLLARDWVTLLLGVDGQRVLQKAGFLVPAGNATKP
jgi:molybdate transport system substrate-binding protein